jgi:hypothetical protein
MKDMYDYSILFYHQGHRVKFLGNGIHHALRCPCLKSISKETIFFIISLCFQDIYCSLSDCINVVFLLFLWTEAIWIVFLCINRNGRQTSGFWSRQRNIFSQHSTLLFILTQISTIINGIKREINFADILHLENQSNIHIHQVSYSNLPLLNILMQIITFRQYLKLKTNTYSNPNIFH